MNARRRRGWLASVLILGACGSSPGTQELSNDYAPKFAGAWFGFATYTYRQNGTAVETDTEALEETLVAVGRNLLGIHFCKGPLNDILGATITSPMAFTVAPHECDLTDSNGCPFTLKVAGGDGVLDGTTLNLSLHGSLEVGFGCTGSAIQFDIKVPLTTTPPRPPPPQNLVVQKDFYGSFDLSWNLPVAELGVDIDVRVGSDDWRDYGVVAPPALVVLGPLVPERSQVTFRVRDIVWNQESDWSAEASSDTGLMTPTNPGLSPSPGRIVVSWQGRPDATMVLERADATFASPPYSWSPLASVAPPVAEYDDTTVLGGHRYAYRFHWVDGAFQSSPLEPDPVLVPDG